jgi:cytoskeleton protein RodZ
MARGNFGERLKREREMREVSADELTKSTRISHRFLDALENEKWDQLPGGVFGRGFVRSIARYLGLDEESLLAEYDLARGEQKIEAPAPYENRIPGPPKWMVAVTVLAILVLLAAVVFGGWYGWKKFKEYRASRHAGSHVIEAPAAQPAATETPLHDTALPEMADGGVAKGLELSIATSGSTRVRVMADGKLVLDAELAAGENRHYSAKENFEVSATDSSAVLLELNGQTMPPLGAPGASGKMVLGWKDLRQASGGTTQP